MKHKIVIAIVAAIAGFFLLDNLVNYAMMRGVNNYYGLNRASHILLVGHSHLMLATDKERLERETGLKVSKYCREGVNVSDKKMMVEHFFNSCNTDSLKYVFYGVDLNTFTGDGLSKNSYKLFYPFMSDRYVDSYIRKEDKPVDYWLHRLVKSTRFNDEGLKNSAIRGWLSNWDNFKNNRVDVEEYVKWRDAGNERHIEMNDNLIREFRETVSLITSRGVRVVLVNPPTLDRLNEYEPGKYAAMMRWFRDFAAADSLVDFWDFNPEFASEHSLFSDRLHLNRHGQDVITNELSKRIKSLHNANSN